MTREQTIDVLNEAFSRRYNSVAQYLLDARPHVTQGEESLLHCIEEIAAADRAQADHLAEIIEALDGIPQVVPYPHEVAELNYLSLAYLREALMGSIRDEIAAYTPRLAAVQSYPPACDALSTLVQTLQQQLTKLSDLQSLPAAPDPPRTGASS